MAPYDYTDFGNCQLFLPYRSTLPLFMRLIWSVSCNVPVFLQILHQPSKMCLPVSPACCLSSSVSESEILNYAQKNCIDMLDFLAAVVWVGRGLGLAWEGKGALHTSAKLFSITQKRHVKAHFFFRCSTGKCTFSDTCRTPGKEFYVLAAFLEIFSVAGQVDEDCLLASVPLWRRDGKCSDSDRLGDSYSVPWDSSPNFSWNF